MNPRAYPPAVWSRFLPIIIIIGLLTTLVYLNKRNRQYESETDYSSVALAVEKETPTERLGSVNLEEFSVVTHIGNVTLKELNEKVYKVLGYEIVKPTLPVPTVRMLNEPKCETVFTEWLTISDKHQPSVPPKQLPVDLTNEFLLSGYTAFTEWYFNDHSAVGDAPRNWDRIAEFMKYSKSDLSAIAYNKESESVFHAMDRFRLDGLNGVVIGSMQPWVEVMALQHGAEKILTVEYNKLKIPEEFQDRLSSILPADFVKNWQKYAGTFDFAVSFSSIEHSGLGRYGDPVDPIGDLREMLKIKCMLKKGGLLFLGIPYGTDAMVFNAHRIYGSVRLAMMFYGFEWLASFSGDTEKPFDLDTEVLHSKPLYHVLHYTLVLKKK